MIEDFSDALYRLAKDRPLRQKMGQAAKQRIREAYDWDRKGEQMQKLYELVTRAESSRTPVDTILGEFTQNV